MSESPNTSNEQQEDLLLDHVYDGIQEFDNPLPGWWKAIFWATIIFCVPYTYWYHFAEGNSVYDKYEADVKAAAEGMEVAPTDAAGLMAWMEDAGHLERGKAMFESTCTPCHAADGGGVLNLGPNLCDDNYKDVKSIMGILRVLENGVPGTAMMSQKSTLNNSTKMAQVAAYVASLRGTTPANPKDPEGEVIPPWSAK